MLEIVIPSVGVSMTEAVLQVWLKQPGEAVAADEPVAEIETDKATMELVSPVAGTLGPHLFEPGAIVPVGVTIVVVLPEGVSPGARLTAEPHAAGPAQELRAGHAPPEASGRDARTAHVLSPRARRLASEQSAAVTAATSTPPPESDRFRSLIAGKVSESWRLIPHFAVTREVNAEPIASVLSHLRESTIDPRPTLTDLLLRALARGLRETERDPSGTVGLAVATPHGVVIPVVANVLDLDPAELAQARTEAVARALAGRLRAADLETTPASTLSNLGAHGIDHFTGIIAVGQTSLLTIGRAIPRVVVEGDGETPMVCKTFYATLNVDHRVYDGAEAARLLVAFAEAAEETSPARLGGDR